MDGGVGWGGVRGDNSYYNGMVIYPHYVMLFH